MNERDLQIKAYLDRSLRADDLDDQKRHIDAFIEITSKSDFESSLDQVIRIAGKMYDLYGDDDVDWILIIENAENLSRDFSSRNIDKWVSDLKWFKNDIKKLKKRLDKSNAN